MGCNDERSTQLLSELMTVRSAYNDTFFKLQKANELAAATEREKKSTVKLFEQKESELRALRRKNRNLTDELTKLKIDFDSLKIIKGKNDTENADLRRENQNLKARMYQLRCGINENRNVDASARRPNRKKELVSNNDSIFEVESLLSDELRRGKRYFLVKWKGYADSHNS